MFELDFVFDRSFSAITLDRSTDRVRLIVIVRHRIILPTSTSAEGLFENPPNGEEEDLHFIYPRGVRPPDRVLFLDFDSLDFIR